VPIQEPIRVGSLRISSGPSLSSTGTSSHEVEEDAGQAESTGTAIEWNIERCRSGDAYSNAKLASLAFSIELERRLRNSPENDGVTSHAINPNSVLTDFQKQLGATSERSAMSYLPPVWIASKVFGFLGTGFRELLMRSVSHGAKGMLHVATLPALETSGGGLFDDTETAFTKCGRAPGFCGRVPESWLPPVTLDEQAAKQLWKISEELVELDSPPIGKCAEEDGDTCELE